MEGKMHTYSFVVERQDDGGFVAYFPALPGCRTEGISYEGTVKNAEEALMLYLQDISENGGIFPEEEMEMPLTLSVTVRE